MQSLTTISNNIYFPSLILITSILVIYLAYQFYRTRQMRVRWLAAEARCTEIETLKQQLQQLKQERDEEKARCVTLEQKYESQCSIIENYKQLQTSDDTLAAERNRQRSARKKTSSKSRSGRDYAGEISSYLKHNPGANKTNTAAALKMGRKTVSTHWPEDEPKSKLEPAQQPQLSPMAAD